MMDLLVGSQLPRCQVQVTVGAADSQTEPVPEVMDLYCHTESVGPHRVSPKRTTWMAGHDHRLVHIGAEAHMVK